ncbi:MAG: class I SAM-dependent methyltransferase [Lachnospiraceae bacterium]|nr:class I SAM-dependent methyltransferase [Lachnospiraceae bacterium]
MEEIQKFYAEDWNESQRLVSQSGQIEYITTMKYLKKYCQKDMSVLDACAGCGVYAFPLADLGCNVIAGDLIDTNVAHIRMENEKNHKLKDIYQGSVLDLSRFHDNSFDVVLNLGSYYHLCDETDREKSLSETLRVLKNGGIYIISYVNRCANYMAHIEELKDNFSFLADYMQKGHIENSTLFYATTPEMIEEELNKYNLKLLHHVATDGPIFVYRDIVEHMSKKDFESFMDIHLSLCDKKSNLGYSEHGLIVAQK